MSRTRTPAAGVLAAVILAATALPSALPAGAADSPEAAVDQLVEIIVGGDLTTLDQVVCEERVDEVREQFDIASALGMPVTGSEPTASLALRIEDAASELIEETDEAALVRLTGTLRIEVETESIRDLVRELLEADGTVVSDEDLDLMVPVMESALSQSQPIDEELELILEDGGWLICGGIGDEPDDPTEVEPSVSFAGLCGLIPLTEINTLGEPGMTFDSSDGAEESCTFSASAAADGRSLSVAFSRGSTIDDYRSFLPDGTDLTVAGLPAYAPEGELLVEAPEGILQVSADLGEEPPAGLEPLAYLTAVAGLYVPLLPEIAREGSESEAEGTGGEPGASFCDSLTVEQLNELTGLAFEEASGGPTFCGYTSADPESFHVVSTTLDQISLDDLKVFLPDGEELTVDGLPAYSAEEGQLWVGIPDAGSTLGVTIILGPVEEDGRDARELALAVAELIIPSLQDQATSPRGDG